MRITRIDFEGRAGYYATAVRRQSGDENALIEVTVLTPEKPNGHTHRVWADCEEDIFSMAECLQSHLEGTRASAADFDAYYRELLKLSDC